MLRFAREGRSIKVVNDQVSAPTYTLDLAAAVIEIIARGGRGTFHVTNQGECCRSTPPASVRPHRPQPGSRPTTSADYASPAMRPAYSVLDNRRLKELGIEQPRPWQEALTDYLQLKGHRLAA